MQMEPLCAIQNLNMQVSQNIWLELVSYVYVGNIKGANVWLYKTEKEEQTSEHLYSHLANYIYFILMLLANYVLLLYITMLTCFT